MIFVGPAVIAQRAERAVDKVKSVLDQSTMMKGTEQRWIGLKPGNGCEDGIRCRRSGLGKY
ncbi:hypothetical protein [Bradyrhizobium sp. 138]|uniref:hypothetical protein n=1 Tax=Bradyrhizobium sp. 138 TaxID=2782615 RepID=UPI001FFC1BBA|nr:hypothetical protein [Bradyrhizobium sp. 138]